MPQAGAPVHRPLPAQALDALEAPRNAKRACPRYAKLKRHKTKKLVTPAKAGIQGLKSAPWLSTLDSGFRRNDEFQ